MTSSASHKKWPRQRQVLCHMVRRRISQETRSLSNLDDNDEQTVFCRSDTLSFRTRYDADDMKTLATQLRGADVFRLHMKWAEEDEDTYSETIDKPLVPTAIKDTPPSEVGSDLLNAEERGMQTIITNVNKRLTEKTTRFYDVLKKHHSKTVDDLYKAKLFNTQDVEKKADKKLL